MGVQWIWTSGIQDNYLTRWCFGCRRVVSDMFYDSALSTIVHNSQHEVICDYPFIISFYSNFILKAHLLFVSIFSLLFSFLLLWSLTIISTFIFLVYLRYILLKKIHNPKHSIIYVWGTILSGLCTTGRDT